MDRSRRIRFLHIPKTAGTSFSNCLRRLYKANRLRHNVFVFHGQPEEDRKRYKALAPPQRERIVLATGHGPLATGIPDIDSLPTITFLRDPVERVKSLLQHMSEGKVGTPDPTRLDLDELLSGEPTWLCNFQTRTLLAGDDYLLPDLPPEVLAEQALAVLSGRLASFGIVEQFDASLLLFQLQLGWTAYPVYTRLNEKDRSRLLRFTPAQEERIRACNAIDLALYQGASQLFRERLDANAEVLARQGRRFAIRQRLAQPWLSLVKLYHRAQVIGERYRRRS